MKQPELGKKVFSLRKKKGFTQEELVEKCNINVRTLQRIEGGEVNPRSFTIKILFKALDYDINKDSKSKIDRLKSYLENSNEKISKQIQTIDLMKNSKNFFYNYFLSTGIVWFFCALAILIFSLHFSKKEIILTIIIPLAFSIFRKFTQNETVESVDKKEE